MDNNIVSTNIDILLDYAALAFTALFAVYTVTRFFLWMLRDGIVLAFIRLLSYRILLPLVLVIGVHLLSMAVVFILPQEVGVVVSAISPNGVRPNPMRAGLNMVLPLFETVERYPITWQTYTMSGRAEEGEMEGDDSIRARTSDGQEVRLDTTVIFRVDATRAVLVHIDWQNRYIDDFVRPLIRGQVRTEVSQFTVDEVNSSSRKDLEQSLEDLLQAELAAKGFILDQFLLRDVTFSAEYAAAVEAKQVADQQEEAALFKANEVRILAQGNADGLKLIAEALEQNPSLVTYEYIQRLAPNIQVMLVPSNNPFLLPLPDLMSQPAVTATTPTTATLDVTLPTVPSSP